MLRVRDTQGAASLCPGLIAGCPYRAWPTGPQYHRLPLKAKGKSVKIKGIYHITPKSYSFSARPVAVRLLLAKMTL